ncbi:hypothetical protein GYMLUDRAFT_396359 [Collybiopsis luxurians FD-317 M1]|uniref:Uncharacterized protein n=1 Tax=Collybiopsis luxurians FD-317 M1 TaxID=944289 RepID=A0A0D0C0W5_9AGAR|nr:hypothetical protein GYMLUDRAFT_396359 [Collybiopsis luxurians FD-317 M1]
MHLCTDTTAISTHSPYADIARNPSPDHRPLSSCHCGLGQNSIHLPLSDAPCSRQTLHVSCLRPERTNAACIFDL